MEVLRMRLFWPGVVAAAAAVIAGAHGQDLDAGKSGPQLFAQDCAACHRSPQGLTKNISGGSLVSFLRQHYTSSSASANTVAAYLLTVPGPRAERQKDEAKQAQPQDRAKVPRPPEPVPSAAARPETQPVPSARQRERLARPADPTANPQDRRKLRRPVQAESATTPVPPPVQAPAGPTAAPAGAEVTPPAATSGDTTGRRSATTAQPSFSQPLP
jgi:hypothetical protein